MFFVSQILKVVLLTSTGLIIHLAIWWLKIKMSQQMCITLTLQYFCHGERFELYHEAKTESSTYRTTTKNARKLFLKSVCAMLNSVVSCSFSEITLFIRNLNLYSFQRLHSPGTSMTYLRIHSLSVEYNLSCFKNKSLFGRA